MKEVKKCVAPSVIKKLEWVWLFFKNS